MEESGGGFGCHPVGTPVSAGPEPEGRELIASTRRRHSRAGERRWSGQCRAIVGEHGAGSTTTEPTLLRAACGICKATTYSRKRLFCAGSACHVQHGVQYSAFSQASSSNLPELRFWRTRGASPTSSSSFEPRVLKRGQREGRMRSCSRGRLSQQAPCGRPRRGLAVKAVKAVVFHSHSYARARSPFVNGDGDSSKLGCGIADSGSRPTRPSRPSLPGLADFTVSIELGAPEKGLIDLSPHRPGRFILRPLARPFRAPGEAVQM
jgi:hypothetical protein